MDDIIVLILTLIFIVAGVFGQIKKRQLPPESSEKAPSSADNFWEILGYEKNGADPVNEGIHLQPVEKAVKEDRFHTTGNAMKGEFTRNLSESTTVTESMKVKRKKAFPLKKAVIYSEILNRKYF
jgi:hypothetical protein